MDAFCDLFRGLRWKSEELGAFSIEMRRFSSQFPTSSWESIFLARPFRCAPLGLYPVLPKQRATFSSSPFSYRGKSHGVKLRGVDPKNHRKRPKRAVEISVRVDQNVGNEASSHLLLLKDMQRYLHTIHTIIGRLCERLALFVPVRGELSDFVNPNYLLERCFAAFLEERFLHFERGSSAFPTAANKGSTIFCRELQTVAFIAQEGRLSSTVRVELGKCAFAYPTQNELTSQTKHSQL